MKTIIKALTVYFLFTAVSVLIYGCCSREFRITEILEIKAFPLQGGSPAPIDTVRGEFYIVAQLASPMVYYLPETGFFSPAYGLSCDDILINDIDSSSFRFSCDRAFLLDGILLPPGSDFGSHPLLQRYINSGEISIWFESAFLEQAVFEKDFYTFSMQARTTDGLDMEQTIQLFMDL